MASFFSTSHSATPRRGPMLSRRRRRRDPAAVLRPRPYRRASPASWGKAFQPPSSRCRYRAAAAYSDFDGAGDRRTASSARYAGSPVADTCNSVSGGARGGPPRSATVGRLRLRQAGPGRFTRRAAKWPIQERGTRSQAITVGSRSGLWRLTAILMARAIADPLLRRAAVAALLAVTWAGARRHRH